MANMSYCRFQNTLIDLRDCVNVMDDAYDFEDMDLSKDERSAMNRMFQQCEEFINNFNRMLEVSEEESLEDDEE